MSEQPESSRGERAGLQARLLGAVVDEVADRGYRSATVAGICSRAGVAPEAFADCFEDKQACFAAAYDLHADTLLAEVTAAAETASDWREGVRRGLAALLDNLARNPRATQAFLVDGLDAGPEAIAIRDRGINRFERLIDRLQERAPAEHPPAAVISEAAVGGVYEVVARRVRSGGTDRLPALHGELAYTVLAPVVGRSRARSELAGAATG